MLIETLARSNPWWANAAARGAQHYPKRRVAQGIANTHVLNFASRRALVIVGPRQVGKSVLLKQVADDLLAFGWSPGNVTLVDFSDPLVESAHPTLEQIVALEPPGLRKDQPRAFLFDEVTHSGDKPLGSGGDWSRALKHLVDRAEGQQHRFIATDSSSAVLRGGTKESGAGRWDELQLETLNFGEYLGLASVAGETEKETLRRDPKAIERFLVAGGFPGHALSPYPSEVHEQLRVDLEARAIFKDLRRTGLDVDRVRSLLVYLLEDSGSLFDPETRRRWLRELGGGDPVDQRSLLAWVDALEDTMLVVRLMPYGASAGARLRERAYPKLYAADSTIVSAFAIPRMPLEDPATYGRLLEAAVYRHLREAIRHPKGDCHYVRSKSGLIEIDFVVSAGKSRIGIEVKSSVARGDPDKLKRADPGFKLDRRFLIHAGPQTQEHEGVTLLALQDFLLDPFQILPDGQRQ
jgi:uncharacterized protein